MITDADLEALASRVLELAERRDFTLITAESCTAGRLAAILSCVPGAGDRFHGGFVTYSKPAKTEILGVPAELLRRKTAVCDEVATAMAKGALSKSPADIAVSITGVAGPDPDEDGNPVGLMYVAIAFSDGEMISGRKLYSDNGREAVLRNVLADVLRALIAALGQSGRRDAGTLKAGLAL
jgi:PncC family amidohydrolase